MSTSADTYMPVPTLSRVLMLSARARAVCGSGSRMVAVLGALAILIAAQLTTRLEHGASAEAFGSVSPATPSAAFHAAPAPRPALAAHSFARWPTSTYVPELVHPQGVSPSTLAHQIAIAPAIGVGASGLARGYDATAPPALS